MVKLAVCVGINDYPGTGNDLFGCVNDAEDWAVELGKRGFEVVKLLDKKATKSAIKKALSTAVRKAKAKDTLVFSYSGHGSWQPDQDGDEADGRDEGWCPYDIDTNGLLLDDDMYNIFSKTAVDVKLIMISDSCHSGTVSRMAPPSTSIASGARIKLMPPDRFLKDIELEIAEQRIGLPVALKTKPDRALLLAGCQDYQFSYDADFGGRPNGAFTYYALQALSKLKATATYVDWFNAISSALPSQSHPQSPNLLGAATQKKWKILA